MKRSQKSTLPKPTKKYKYYAENFEHSKENDVVVNERPKSFSKQKTNITNTSSKAKKAAVVHSPPKKRHTSVQNTPPKQAKPAVVHSPPKAKKSAVVHSPPKKQHHETQQLSRPDPSSEEEDYNSMDEFEKLEEECIKQSSRDPDQQKQPSEQVVEESNSKPPPQTKTAAEMMDQREQERKWHNKRKLFDDSESDEGSEEETQVKQNAKRDKENMSGVVKKMIYGVQETKKPLTSKTNSEQIPEALTQILEKRAKELDKCIGSHKKEYEICLRLERELTEGLNENNRSKRLHNKSMKEMEENIEKQLEQERNKLKKERRVFERQNKAMKNLPNRKEREDIAELSKQVKQLEENIKKKAQSNKLTTDRLRKQVTEQKQKYEELTEERDTVYAAIQGSTIEENIDEENELEEDKHEEEKQYQDVHNADKKSDDSASEDDNDEGSVDENKNNDNDQASEQAQYQGYMNEYDYSENNAKTQNQKSQKPVNFYHPAGEVDMDINNVSHSPHFGSRKSDLAHNSSALSAYAGQMHRPNHENEADAVQPGYHANEGEHDGYDTPPSENDEDQEDDDYNSSQYNMQFLKQYHGSHPENQRVVEENVGA